MKNPGGMGRLADDKRAKLTPFSPINDGEAVISRSGITNRFNTCSLIKKSHWFIGQFTIISLASDLKYKNNSLICVVFALSTKTKRQHFSFHFSKNFSNLRLLISDFLK